MSLRFSSQQPSGISNTIGFSREQNPSSCKLSAVPLPELLYVGTQHFPNHHSTSSTDNFEFSKLLPRPTVAQVSMITYVMKLKRHFLGNTLPNVG